MLQAYRPSKRVPWQGAVVLLFTTICIGPALGGFAFILFGVIWLIVLFPLVLGLLAGFLLSKIVLHYKVRSPSISIAMAIMMAIMISAAFHSVGYDTFQFEARQVIAAQQGLRDSAAQAQVIDGFLVQETGYTGFLGYLKFTPQEGVSFGRLGSSQILTLNEPMTWLYWVVEFGIIIAGAIAGVRDDSKNHFVRLATVGMRAGSI